MAKGMENKVNTVQVCGNFPLGRHVLPFATVDAAGLRYSSALPPSLSTPCPPTSVCVVLQRCPAPLIRWPFKR